MTLCNKQCKRTAVIRQRNEQMYHHAIFPQILRSSSMFLKHGQELTLRKNSKVGNCIMHRCNHHQFLLLILPLSLALFLSNNFTMLFNQETHFTMVFVQFSEAPLIIRSTLTIIILFNRLKSYRIKNVRVDYKKYEKQQFLDKNNILGSLLKK